MIDDPNPESRAAYALAEFLAKDLLRAAEERRTFLYCWERDAIEWLLDWQKRTGGGTMNWWTYSYLRGEIPAAPLYEHHPRDTGANTMNGKQSRSIP